MSGPAADCFRVWLQPRKLEYPGDNTVKCLNVAWTRCSRFQDQHESAVSHRMPACSSLAAVFFREGRNHEPACVVKAKFWCPCIHGMADDAADLPCSVHNYTLDLRAVPWVPVQGRAAHSCSHAYEPQPLSRCLSFNWIHREQTKPKHDLDAGEI